MDSNLKGVMYIHVCISVYTYTYIYIYLHTYIYTYVHVCMQELQSKNVNGTAKALSRVCAQGRGGSCIFCPTNSGAPDEPRGFGWPMTDVQKPPGS